MLYFIIWIFIYSKNVINQYLDIEEIVRVKQATRRKSAVLCALFKSSDVQLLANGYCLTNAQNI